MKLKNSSPSFQDLQPERILQAVEEGLGQRSTGLYLQLNSYINRVYELELESGERVIAKFYRPGRWQAEALAEEHAFTAELAELELPVIAPLVLHHGSTLGQSNGINYAIFPKRGGRFLDELSDEQWLELGHLLGRLHQAGSATASDQRITLLPDQVTGQQLDFLLETGFIPPELQAAYDQETRELLELITPLFSGTRLQRIHGDCHFANLLYRPGESFLLFDFDDMANGPAVHDFWMLLPGYYQDSRREVELFLEGYETFHPFNRQELELIEPLRAMRYINFQAWCAHQALHGGVSPTISANWGSSAYWQQEINDLRQQRQRIMLALQQY